MVLKKLFEALHYNLFLGISGNEHKDMTTVENRQISDRVDCASVQSEPIRTLPIELTQKRDSFSDSGAEGSGNNTPTRGRTYTEGLLRFVQDTSLQQKPERKTSNIEQPNMYPGNMAAQQQPPTSVAVSHVSVIQQVASNVATSGASMGGQQPPQAGGYQKELSHEPTRPGSVASITSGINPAAQYNLTPPSAGILYDPASGQHFFRPAQQQQQAAPLQQQQPEHLVYRPQQRSMSPSLVPEHLRHQELHSHPQGLSGLAAAQQPNLLGGETHSIRQPIMSSNAQPSIGGYNAISGAGAGGMSQYTMVMPNASQTGMYSIQQMPQARYQGLQLGNPSSPHILTGNNHPGLHYNTIHGGQVLQHQPQSAGGFAAAAGHLNNTQYGATYPNSGSQLATAPPGSLIIPDPVTGGRLTHTNPAASSHLVAAAAAAGSPHINLVNPNLGLMQQHPVSMAQLSGGHLGGGAAGGMINPASISNLSVNHGLPMGASYPSLPDYGGSAGFAAGPTAVGQLAMQQQQPQQQILFNHAAAAAPMQHRISLSAQPGHGLSLQGVAGLNPTPTPSLQGVSLNPTPAPSLQGVSLNPTPAPSMTGSMHESVHGLDDASVHGSEVGQ